MPGPLEQLLLTPSLVQHDINMRKAQQAYAQKLKPYLNVPIGGQIPLTNDWITYITNPNRSEPQVKQGCAMVNYVKTTYQNINSSIRDDTGTNLTQSDVTQKNAELQTELLRLTEERDELLEDNEVSEMRDAILRSGNAAISNHQVYLLGRPLRPASIPYIWALIVLFIGMGLLIFYTFFPYTMPPLDIILLNFYFFFSSPWVWSILFGLASIVILFLSLRIAHII